ncbi:MAG: histidinol-phosphate transaminase [Oscillospiraceae bacterium]|nr:histidinol-phosphate transaminase [Oscillospiraceae bacterium]
MAYQVNEKLRLLQPYTPTEETPGIIHLDANESFLNLPPALTEKAASLVQQTAFNRYPDPYATQLCEAFGSYYQVDKKHVTAGNGSDELISLLVSNFLMKGETLVTTAPDFSMYAFYPKLAEAVCIEICKGDGFTVTPQQMIDKVKESHARMLLFSNPCNPTSLGLTKEQILQIVENLPEVLVVVDEAYMDFWESEQSVLGKESQYENLIVLKTCSKMGLAAIRLGFAVANEKLTGLLHSAKSPYNVNSLTQRIGSLLLQEGSTLHKNTENIKRSRDDLQSGLAAVLRCHPAAFQLYQSCTNFVTLRFADAAKAYDFLMARKISVRKFPAFLRVTAGSAEENQAFLSAIDKFFTK